jgi:hypothetical protein
LAAREPGDGRKQLGWQEEIVLFTYINLHTSTIHINLFDKDSPCNYCCSCRCCFCQCPNVRPTTIPHLLAFDKTIVHASDARSIL